MLVFDYIGDKIMEQNICQKKNPIRAGYVQASYRHD
jgi:hypothetical protein